MRRYKTLIILLLIVAFGFYLRTYNLSWDNGYSFHPDERAIAIKVSQLSIPKSLSNFLSENSSLNPQFFAYGSLPLYILRFTSYPAGLFIPELTTYPGIFILGRLISAIFDTITIFLVFLIARKLFNNVFGLSSAFLYSSAVLPIQLSHYFAVDTLLNTFIYATLYFLLLFIAKQTYKNSLLLGLFFGLSLATKVSALVMGPVIFIGMVFVFLKRSPKKIILNRITIYSILIMLATAFSFAITQPYALIDYKQFLDETTYQSRMSSDPFMFPYTLQFVGKVKYFHEISQIFLWGLGPIITLVSVIGLIAIIIKLLAEKKKNYFIAIFIFSGLLYFLLFGSFAVGWVRYMLPIYPFLAITGGWMIGQIVNNRLLKPKLTTVVVVFLILIYPISYISIYTKPNTRIQASDWVHKNIPKGSTIANEHWDDSIPVYNSSNYLYATLPLYEPDLPRKWETIEQAIKSSDYIIIASNRLYGPLQKLTKCSELPAGKCYPKTAQYYKDLFGGKLGFQKVAEFTSYPTVPVLNVSLPDDTASEDFTVFDHPKIMIFKKIDLEGITH